ncbi:MAG: RDD family protein [Gammaproteobacteria bacterium]|nr:RDD family protein [Gammaproteobacteria bacterium]
MRLDAGAIRYAGFWRRVAASLIDSIIFGVLAAVVLYLIYGAGYFAIGDAVTGPMFVMPTLGELIVNYLAPVIVTVFLWIKYLGTPGKLLMGCHVVDARTGAPLSTGQALLRYFGYYLSALPLGLGFLWVGWDKRKQGFHDKLAKTVVVMETESHEKSLDELERDGL